jgi:hypothetical protein
MLARLGGLDMRRVRLVSLAVGFALLAQATGPASAQKKAGEKGTKTIRFFLTSNAPQDAYLYTVVRKGRGGVTIELLDEAAQKGFARVEVLSRVKRLAGEAPAAGKCHTYYARPTILGRAGNICHSMFLQEVKPKAKLRQLKHVGTFEADLMLLGGGGTVGASFHLYEAEVNAKDVGEVKEAPAKTETPPARPKAPEKEPMVKGPEKVPEKPPEKPHDPRLLAGLGAADEATREKTVAALLKMKAEAVPTLREGLRASVPAVRLRAAAALGKLGADAKEGVPALAAALKDPSAEVRRQAALSLGAIGPAAREAVKALTEVLRDADREARLLAAYALERVMER